MFFRWGSVFLYATALSVLPWTSQALFPEDAGSFDFTVATTGHGVTRFVYSSPAHGAVITSDSPIQAHVEDVNDAGIITVIPTSCFVASRKISDGSLLWRRNVCSTPTSLAEFAGESPLHVVAALGDYLYTMDQTGVVRGWKVATGDLLWDTPTKPSVHPRLWTFTKDGSPYVAVASDYQDLTIVCGETGEVYGTVLAEQALAVAGIKPKNGEVVRWMSVLPEAAGSGEVHTLVGFVKHPSMTTKGNRVALLDLSLSDDDVTMVRTKTFEDIKSEFSTLSLQLTYVVDEWHGLALIAAGNDLIDFTITSGNFMGRTTQDDMHPAWTKLTSVLPLAENHGMIEAKGVDRRFSPVKETSAIFRFDDWGMNGWQQLYGLDERDTTQNHAIVYCDKAELVVALSLDSILKLWRHDTMASHDLQVEMTSETADDMRKRISPLQAMSFSGDSGVLKGESVDIFKVVSCTKDEMSILAATPSGTTTQLTFSVSGESVALKTMWEAEEGLSDISSAVVLDGSHLGLDDLVEEEAVVLGRLGLPSRLASQWNSVVNLVTGLAAGVGISRRDHVFGFVKIAALLSPSTHRIWGMITSGEDRGSIRWKLDLPKTAKWHTMVHGTMNSPKAIHGINGGTHSREILVLSAADEKMAWTCLDGTNGAKHSSGEVAFDAPVVQVLPMYGGTGLCRQTALLLHTDQSLSVVPNDAESIDYVMQFLRATPNGLYTHLVDKTDSNLQSFQITEAPVGSSINPFRAMPMGKAKFAGETIVKVVYPTRDEVVQSMCTVLGDDSLLLKYINPHVAVIFTMTEKDESVQPGKIASALSRKETPKKQRKPAGVGDAGSKTPATGSDNLPNMFLNVVDTVSGRVLYRTSHADVDAVGPIAAVISENWVVYSFVNKKTRRAELGVLTLHEGMIHSTGLTLFSSPEQTLSFSSFEARESKPVVLAKTYTYPKIITALGATSTRGGISNRKILVASADGKVTALDRKMLETRRPTGEVKEVEKTEGLYQ
jgi:ER membrane protein complex subunit 1, C-terminal